MTLKVSKVHRFNIQVRLKLEMCLEELDTFEKIPVVLCSEDMWVFFNPIIIARLEM